VSAPAPERARVDGEGRLVEATSRLLALNARAGGAVGAMLAVPQLARLVDLARTLRVPLARTVLAADGDDDVELYARARPEPDGVTLDIESWEIRPPRKSWLIEQPSQSPSTPGSPWTWEVDARLNLTDVELGTTDIRPTDVIGRPLTRLIRLIEDDDGDHPLLAALADGAAFDGQRAVRRDLAGVEYELSATPCFDDLGRFSGFVGKAVPVVAETATADALIGTAGFAAQLGRAVRAPLDRIIARAESIGNQVDGPLRRDYVDYAGDIASTGRHLLALVEDISDLEAVEGPGFAVSVESIDLADVARRAAGLLAVRAKDAGVRIDRLDAGEKLAARGDFQRVLQILVNLIGNAVRYSPPGGLVWIRSEEDGDNAIIVVADQGRGIAAENHERIFEKFERLDPLEHGGSGLGLYISRRLARAMGGDITVESAPGQGARFVLTLPAV